MAISTKAEARALTSEEQTFVSNTRHPALQTLPDDELRKLASLVRERRDRAQSEANRQRREMRRKGEPKGTKPAAGDAGNRFKAEILAAAMVRLNAETKRRQRMAAHIALRASANRALALKQEADSKAGDFNTRRAHSGMKANPNRRAEDLVNPMERGRQRKAKAVAQAKSDSRRAEASAG